MLANRGLRNGQFFVDITKIAGIALGQELHDTYACGMRKALAYLAKVSVSSQYLLFWAISFLFVVRKDTNIIFEKQGNYCFFS